MAIQMDWTELHPEYKWKILLKQKRFALWALYSSIGSMMLGFDFGVAGTATAFPAFQKQFGIPFPSQPSGYLVPARYQSGWFGASTGGMIIGDLITGQLLDIIGRKHIILIGSLITGAGVAMQVASNEWRLFLAGRLISAIGFAGVYIESPVWIGENCRPELRGFFLCLMNGSIVLGQFLLSLIAQGTSKIHGKWSYETIIVLQFFFIVLLLLLYPFYPESPYYLLKKGRPEEARQALNRIHGTGDRALIDAEMKRIEDAIATSEKIQQAAATKGPLLLQCWQGTNLKRTIIAILPAAGQQLIGAAFVLGYVTYFLSLIGVARYFTVSVILYVVMLLSNLSAFFFIETAGRRRFLVSGITVLTFVLLLMGIMGCFASKGTLWFSVVCIFIWAIVYQATIGAIGFAFGSEISTLPLRPTVQSLIGLTQGAVAWVIGFVTPYMINPDAGNLGAKVGFVFFGLGVPLCIAFYFLIPETRGLSFDDMDYLFNKKVSCRRFQSVMKEQREEDILNVRGKRENLKGESAIVTSETEGGITRLV
ncbi:general substrate transporter [Zopfia rhizophila CBS 207.26]|uniref:General substrate transporter n=1 Tax=Zopfia rhizophila CBS 207.26 TaxID=1314779 RepID=A0A6A6E4B8_9PEZI|nr:general substrate transporter [Zopfia rhizophila CBS 207.26]